MGFDPGEVARLRLVAAGDQAIARVRDGVRTALTQALVTSLLQTGHGPWILREDGSIEPYDERPKE